MDLNLNQIEVRVLGSLIEKEITTPEYYPLSLNSLMAACNQKSNRDPVMNLSESEVAIAIDSLREKKLAWVLSTSGGRVPKYEHNLRSLFTFSNKETAVICLLFLRGAQTVGEIKGRSERLCNFKSLEEVEATIKLLVQREDGPYIKELQRQPGQKENRFMHLFSTELLQLSEIGLPVIHDTIVQKNDRISILEQDVRLLREELSILKSEFEAFRKQLE